MTLFLSNSKVIIQIHLFQWQMMLEKCVNESWMRKALANRTFDMATYETLVLSLTQMILYKIGEFCIQTADITINRPTIEMLKISSAHWQQ